MRHLSELNLNIGGKPVPRPPPTDQQIEQFQSVFGTMLPAALRELLAFSNGGHPELDSYLPNGMPANESYCAVDHFYHLADDSDSTESMWSAQRTYRPILGASALVFASDGGGNQFFVDLSRTPHPVLIWYHDEPDAIVELAPSFEAFIDGLRVDPNAI